MTGSYNMKNHNKTKQFECYEMWCNTKMSRKELAEYFEVTPSCIDNMIWRERKRRGLTRTRN